MSLGGGVSGAGGRGDKGLRLNLADTIRLAWADPELRQRLVFVMAIFAVFCLGIHVPVPIPGVDPGEFENLVQNNAFFNLINTFGGGGLKRISIFALGLNPYITASIIMQILQAAFPQWKKELKEGGEYARRNMNKRTRLLSIVLSFVQGWGIIQLIKNSGAIPPESQTMWVYLTVILFWTAGSMMMLWMGEQISERGIGNGVSLMIFAGIIISFPSVIQLIANSVARNFTNYFQVGMLVALFLGTTWFVTLFTIAQRRIPIQHMRRQFGTKAVGGQTSYLPLSLNLVGVIPIIFAVSLVYMPAQFAMAFPANSPMHNALNGLAQFLLPNFKIWQGWVGALFYMLLIFFFTYFYTAIQYSVDDMADNLKRGGSFIPGVRPGKQTKDFLDAVISRITIVGALFLSVIALGQYVVPLIAPDVPNLGLLFGTSLLIMVSVALETMRQIEANLLMKQYGQ